MLLLKAILVWIVASMPMVALVLLLEFLYWLGDKLDMDGGLLVLTVLLFGAWMALLCLL